MANISEIVKKLNKEQEKLEKTQKKLQESTSDAKSAEETYKKVSTQQNSRVFFFAPQVQHVNGNIMKI